MENCRDFIKKKYWSRLSMQKTHSTKKETQQTLFFEKFVTEGIEKVEELAKEGAMVDGGLMAQVRAFSVQQERDEVYADLRYAASLHCLVERVERL